MNDESRPKAAHESATTDPSIAVPADIHADLHCAFVAGYEQGKAERVEAEIEDQVQARLHARVIESLGMARQSAIHGPAFSQLVRESGERDE